MITEQGRGSRGGGGQWGNLSPQLGSWGSAPQLQSSSRAPVTEPALSTVAMGLMPKGRRLFDARSYIKPRTTGEGV